MYLPGCQDFVILNYSIKYKILVLSQLGKGKFNKTVFAVAVGVAAGHTGLGTIPAWGHFASTPLRMFTRAIGD